MNKRYESLAFLEKGVTKVPVRKEPQGTNVDLTDELPENIKSLIGIASNISKQQIETDDRLKYLME